MIFQRLAMYAEFAFLTGCLVFFSGCHKSERDSVTKFYVIRHAERYPGFEGSLTWYGRLRAGDLMRFLKDSGIQRIYLTPFARSRQTADSLRLLQRIDTVQYRVDTSGMYFINSFKSHKDHEKNILVIGNDHTVPAILRKLGVSYPRKSLPDTAFGLLFEVINDHGKISMRTLHYGRPSLPADTSRKAQ